MFGLSNRKKEREQMKILNSIFERSKEFISIDSYNFCIELIDHNEAGIALEILCSQIEDDEIKIPKELYLDIKYLLESWSSVHDISYYDIKISDVS